MAKPQGQNDWRYCSKCYCLWWNGRSDFKGVCAAGGQHTPEATQAGLATLPANPKGGGGSYD